METIKENNDEVAKVISSRYIKDKKYLKYLKKSKTEEIINLSNVVQRKLEEINEFIDKILIELYSRSENGINSAAEFINFVYRTYIKWESDKGNRTSFFQQTVDKILKTIEEKTDACGAIGPSSVFELIKTIEDMNKQIGTYYTSFNLQDKRNLVSIEEKKIEESYLFQERMYELYKTIKDDLNVLFTHRIILSDFLPSLEQEYIQYKSNEDESFRLFLQMIYNKELITQEAINKKEVLENVESLISSVKHYSNTASFEKYYSLWYCIHNYKSYKKFLDDMKENIRPKLSKSGIDNSTIKLFDEALFWKDYKNIIRVLNAEIQLRCICRRTSYNADIKEIIDSAISKKSETIPYLRHILRDFRKYELNTMSEKNLKELFTQTNMIEIFLKTAELTEKEIVYSSLLPNWLEYCSSRFIEILDYMETIKSIMLMEEFTDYLKYFECIDNQELTQDEIIDETIKKYIIANKEEI